MPNVSTQPLVSHSGIRTSANGSSAGHAVPRPRTVDVTRDQRDLRAESLACSSAAIASSGVCIGISAGHGEPIAIRLVLLGDELVVQAADGDVLLLVGQLQQRDADRRIQHGEVDSRFAATGCDSAWATSPSRSTRWSPARARSVEARRLRDDPPARRLRSPRCRFSIPSRSRPCPLSRTKSKNTGASSTMCPSPSRTG